MAYRGTTSTSENTPNIVAQFMGSTGGVGPKLWMYNSTNLRTDMSSTGFFTDGQLLGMTTLDVLMQINASGVSFHGVNVVTSTGVGLSLGKIVTSAS